MALSRLFEENPRLKQFVHYLLIPKGEARPRTWVRWLVNPFFHTYKKGAIVRSRARMDVLPFSPFEMGAQSVIEDFSTVNNGVGPVIIGNRTLIGIGCVVIGPVTFGNNIILAQNIVVSGLNHRYEDPEVPIMDQDVYTKPIVIEDDCWIGANAVITAGVTIGRHAVVAAGSVVTKNVPPFSIAAGNPARIIKQYNPATKTWERMRL